MEAEEVNAETVVAPVETIKADVDVLKSLPTKLARTRGVGSDSA